MADAEKQFYSEKLEMERQEHEIRMRILLLQEQYEIKRMKTLEEYVLTLYSDVVHEATASSYWQRCLGLLDNLCLVFLDASHFPHRISKEMGNYKIFQLIIYPSGHLCYRPTV